MATTTAVTTYKNFINGEWVASRSGETFENRNPANTDDLIGVFQQSNVLLRRAQHDGHAIERHAAARLAQDPARDFDRLAPFAWRRKQLDFVERIARRRHCLGKGRSSERPGGSCRSR